MVIHATANNNVQGRSEVRMGYSLLKARINSRFKITPSPWAYGPHNCPPFWYTPIFCLSAFVPARLSLAYFPRRLRSFPLDLWSLIFLRWNDLGEKLSIGAYDMITATPYVHFLPKLNAREKVLRQTNVLGDGLVLRVLYTTSLWINLVHQTRITFPVSGVPPFMVAHLIACRSRWQSVELSGSEGGIMASELKCAD
jgi:hypothetical protein